VTGITIDKTLTIRGHGATSTFLQSAPTPGTADRTVFTIAQHRVVTFENLTIRNGFSHTTENGGGITNRAKLILNNVAVVDNQMDLTSGYFGAGGIYTDGDTELTISTSTIANNSYTGSLYGVGGIYAHDADSLTITASTIAGNSGISSDPATYPYNYADITGGIDISAAAVSMTNTTIIGNTTNSYGGGINTYNDAGFSMTNVTMYRNHADEGGGGMLYVQSSGSYELKVKNSLFAGNTNNDSGDDFVTPDNFSAGQVEDGGYNLVENTTNVNWNAIGDINGEQSDLIEGALADNGATNGVQTLALKTGSVAINAGDDVDDNNGVPVPVTDARGFYRSGRPDIGAYEYNGIVGAPPTDDSDSPPDSDPTPDPTPIPVVHQNSGHGSSGGSRHVVVAVNTPIPINSSVSIVPPHLPSPFAARDIEKGMTGDDVFALQNLLIAKKIGPAARALAVNKATHYFGALTKAALIEYQKAMKITPAIGYFGPKTKASMGF
jgi:hypothetical protein